jgi:outer membrane protein
MVRRTTIIVVLLILCIPSLPALAKDLKIGYIISEVIRDEYEEYQTAQQQLDEERQEWEAQLKEKEDEIKNLEKELVDKEFVYSEARKENLRNEIVTKSEALYQLQQELTNRLMQRNAELSGPINARINEIINRIGDEEEYDFIFDANQGNIVYAKDEYDLTDRLLNELEKD